MLDLIELKGGTVRKAVCSNKSNVSFVATGHFME